MTWWFWFGLLGIVAGVVAGLYWLARADML